MIIEELEERIKKRDINRKVISLEKIKLLEYWQ